MASACGGGMGVGGKGGSAGVGASGTGGALACGGAGGALPPLDPGSDCPTDGGSCGPEAFCGAVELNGAMQFFSCIPKGSCQTCGCLLDELTYYYRGQNGTCSIPASCACPEGLDGGASAISRITCVSP